MLHLVPDFTLERQWSSRTINASVIVAIPACNEAAHIAACLAAFDAQITRERFTVLILFNNCTDDGYARAIAAAASLSLQCLLLDGALSPFCAHAGGARRAAMDHAAMALEATGYRDGVLLTSDADSRPAPDWIATNLAAIARGAECVAGAIALDETDACALPAHLHARGALEARYDAALTEIFARLDPRPHDPWPNHAGEPGASLAVTLAAYRAIGGLPRLPSGEDRALAAAIDAAGLRVRHDPAVRVVTSGRLAGRAAGGVADTIRLRCEQPDAPCDPYLEPALTARLRGLQRGRLRALSAAGGLARHEWARALRIDARAVDPHWSFAQTWAHCEARSAMLARTPLRPADLPRELAVARAILRRLRGAEVSAAPAHPADSEVCDPPL